MLLIFYLLCTLPGECKWQLSLQPSCREIGTQLWEGQQKLGVVPRLSPNTTVTASQAVPELPVQESWQCTECCLDPCKARNHVQI